ncbi:MAG: tRNA adenosine(34) deaminase TadA [Victivallales bacterium]|nr:tRNA adenosine(34) deaminase TadA [Victivallales bacterium]
MSEEIPQFGSDEFYMREAWRQAVEAAEHGEVPVGAVVVWRERIIAKAWNQVEMLKDGTAHAEMLALTQASAVVGDWRLNECCLYVTKEPCPMCAGAMVNCRLGRLVFGCRDPRGGAAGGALDLTHYPGLLHQFDCQGGVWEEKCAKVLRDFFRKQRTVKNTGNPEE